MSYRYHKEERPVRTSQVPLIMCVALAGLCCCRSREHRQEYAFELLAIHTSQDTPVALADRFEARVHRDVQVRSRFGVPVALANNDAIAAATNS